MMQDQEHSFAMQRLEFENQGKYQNNETIWGFGLIGLTQQKE
jgi:hypothetical protein